MTPTLYLTLRLPTSIPEALLTDAIALYLPRGKWEKAIRNIEGTEIEYNLILDPLSLTGLAQLSEVLRSWSHKIPSLSYSGSSGKASTPEPSSSTTPCLESTSDLVTGSAEKTSTQSRSGTRSRRKKASSSSLSRTGSALAKYRKGG
jgi:hypothetical protein